MNWCKPHWDYLKDAIEKKGIGHLVGHGAGDGIKGLLGERFDPLMGCWSRINAQMLQSPGLQGRILVCPLCILVDDGQPHLVENWVDACTNEAVTEAVRLGLVEEVKS